MDKFKNKYEIILGFVTLVVSLSAFKEELSKINFELGYISISAANYFLYCVYGFSFCLYLYIMENVFRDTKIGTWKLWDYLLKIAFFIFIFILLTPLLILLNIGIYKLLQLLSTTLEKTKTSISGVLSIISSLVTMFFALSSTIKILYERKRRRQEEIEVREIQELDNANRLFEDHYYSQSILESFKVFELHLFKELIKRDVRAQPHRINELISLASRMGIIIPSDLPKIHDLRFMRNAAAHSDIDYTRQQAEFALNFVKELLRRNAS